MSWVVRRRNFRRTAWAALIGSQLLLAGCSGSTDHYAASARSGDSRASAGAPYAGGAGRPASPGTLTPAATAGSTAAAGSGGSPPSGVAGAPPGATAGTGGPAQPPTPTGDGFYHLESLGRGVVAVQVEGGIYVGWRMLGTEYEPNAADRVRYQLLRDGAVIAEVTDSTNYLDASGNTDARYSVKLLRDGAASEESAAATPWSESYLRIPIEPPSGEHVANDASAADLDGDGEYELVLKWDPTNAKDNSQEGVTGNVFLDALKLNGQRLWRIDLGPNIRAGAHYTQFVAFDFDDDGKAELAVKTAPGTRDGRGEFLQRGPAQEDDDSEIYRNGDGYVLTGPEYLTVFGGQDGSELATVAYEVARGDVGAWGDDYGNRVDRFLAGVAFLDDSGLPSLVMARGYYTRSTVTAWNFREGSLSRLWVFDSDKTPRDASGKPFTGQGAHSLSIANSDADPQQEIIYGAMTIDHDGRGKCSTGVGHGDALHVADFDMARPGLEVFMPHENSGAPYWTLRDADNCEMVRKGEVADSDTGRGVAADILPDNPGFEMWTSGGIPLLSAKDGQRVGDTPASINFVIWWDADESRELENDTAISKYGGGTLVRCEACAANNGTKSTPALSGDLVGDWREEVVWREADNRALRLYTTTDVTKRRLPTLMHDAQYRVAIAWQNVAYNQPPHPSFHIGAGMQPPPKPNLHTR